MSKKEILIWIKGFVAACGGWLDEEETADMLCQLEHLTDEPEFVTVYTSMSCTGDCGPNCTCMIKNPPPGPGRVDFTG